MNKKIKLNDVKIEWLNKRALVLISIFSTAAYKQERVVIDLRASSVLDEISALVKRTDNTELKSLYQRIKREVRISLREVNLEDDDVLAAESKSSKQEAKSTVKDSIYIDRAFPR